MDGQSLAAFETRAAAAEQRLAVLEAKLGSSECSRAAWGRVMAIRRSGHACRRPAIPAARVHATWLPARRPAGSASSAVDTTKYVAELLSLKDVLLAAQAEQAALEKRVAEVGAAADPPLPRQA